MKKLLIQANNLDMVIDTFMYIYRHPGCKKQDIADYCGFTLRQADYYTNACKYLDLIDDNLLGTPLAKDIFTYNPAEVQERVYERIISDDLIGQIFARIYMLPENDCSEYAKAIVKEYFPGYSDAVYERRTDNMIKWCTKIISFVKSKY